MSENPFIGAWRLVSYTVEDENHITAYPMGADAEGVIMYTPDGYMSVQIQEAGRGAFENENIRRGTEDEWAAAGRSYLAYAGAYEVREGEVIHAVGFSLFPNWVGSDLHRFYRFEGDRLYLSTAPEDTGRRTLVSRLVWERASA